MDYLDEERGQPLAQDYQTAIDEIISKEFENRHKDLQSNYENAIKIIKELQNNNYKLSTEKKNLESSFEQSIVEARRNGKIEAIAEITGGYSLGQKLYYPHPEYENVPCPFCGGSHQLSIIKSSSGEEAIISCPKCNNGTTNIAKYKPIEVYIDSFNIYMLSETSEKFYKARCKFEKEIKTQSKYSATHSQWEDRTLDPKDCFQTIEECQLECDNRNSKTHNK